MLKRHVELRCTCGAYPPADARFCHKCGRPLRESSADTPDAEPETMAMLPPPLPGAETAGEPAGQTGPVVPKTEIGFGDALALRVCMLTAAIAMFAYPFVGLLPGVVANFGVIGLLGASGVMAVVLYRRRSGEPVSVLGGARLGWITGVFCFVILLVLVTIAVLLADEQAVRQVMAQNPDKFTEELREKLNQLMKSPEQAAAMLILYALVSFVTMSMMASVGGALGAKYFGQRQSQP